MKKILAILLCTALLLSLLGCGEKTGSNDLWDEASPETSAMFLYVFDNEVGRVFITFNQTDEHAILDRLSAVDATPAADWTPKKVKQPVYGIEIGTMDGPGISAAWSNGYLITRDGSAYEFDFDFSALENDYKWEQENRVIESLSAMPCGRLLSEGPDGWLADRLFPVGDLTAPDGITMTRKEQTADSLTVELTNNSDADWMFGEYFSLHVLLDGVWYDVPVLDDKNYAFTDIGILLNAGESHEKTYNLFAYGTLPEGRYRLVVFGLSVEFTRPYTDQSIVSISNETENYDPVDALEYFFEDTENQYYFSNPSSQYIIVCYADGTEENVKAALQAGRITIDDLDTFGIDYYTEPKA